MNNIQRAVADALRDADPKRIGMKISDVDETGRNPNEIYFWTHGGTMRFRIQIDQVDVYGIPVQNPTGK
jgi:hypothetical protein